MVALLTSVRNSPCFGGLRRTKTCHWQLFARPSVLFGYFLHDAKSDNSFSLQRTSRFGKPRISTPKLQLRTNPIKTFTYFLLGTKSMTKKPSLAGRVSRFCKPRNSAHKQQIRAIQLNPSAALRRQLFPTFCKAQKVGQKTYLPILAGSPAERINL